MSQPPKPNAAAPAAKPAPPPAAPAPLGSEKDAALLWARIRKRPAPLIGIAYTAPVFIAYQLGILLLERPPQEEVPRSGFDLVTTWLIRAIEPVKPAYVLLTLALTLAVLVATWVHQKRGKIAESPHKRVFWESVGVAVVGLALGVIAQRTLLGPNSAASALPWLDRLVLAVGSAFYSEVAFRGLLIWGGSWLLGKITKLKRPWVTWLICSLVSSLLAGFAQALSVSEEPFPWGVVAYGAVEGVFFAALYVMRGFAVAVYAHTFYNLVSLVLPY